MISEALQRQLGPLQAWQWGIVLGGGYLGYRLLTGKSVFPSTGSSGSTLGVTSGGAAVGDPGFGTSGSQGEQGPVGPAGPTGPTGPGPLPIGTVLGGGVTGHGPGGGWKGPILPTIAPHPVSSTPSTGRGGTAATPAPISGGIKAPSTTLGNSFAGVKSGVQAVGVAITPNPSASIASHTPIPSSTLGIAAQTPKARPFTPTKPSVPVQSTSKIGNVKVAPPVVHIPQVVKPVLTPSTAVHSRAL